MWERAEQSGGNPLHVCDRRSDKMAWRRKVAANHGRVGKNVGREDGMALSFESLRERNALWSRKNSFIYALY